MDLRSYNYLYWFFPSFLIQIAKGLNHCHIHLTAHLDLKPSNILGGHFVFWILLFFGDSRDSTHFKMTTFYINWRLLTQNDHEWKKIMSDTWRLLDSKWSLLFRPQKKAFSYQYTDSIVHIDQVHDGQITWVVSVTGTQEMLRSANFLDQSPTRYKVQLKRDFIILIRDYLT